jgi:hypothetical protein
MTVNYPDSRLLAACLRCLQIGERTRNAGYMRWWLRRADYLLQTGGSEQQRSQLKRYEERLKALAASDDQTKFGIVV